MPGQPRDLSGAWRVYDGLCADDRVVFLREPENLEPLLRAGVRGSMVSPKLWVDAYLVAFAEAAKATLVTCCRAQAQRSRDHVLLA